MSKSLKLEGLYVITDSRLTNGKDVEAAEQALKAGCKLIQYREKTLPFNEMLAKAKKIKKSCTDYDALFVVNDRLKLATESKADGLHLGQQDASFANARKEFGGIIGLSASTFGEAMQAQDADYLGVGPIFATRTKEDANPPCGLEELARIAKDSGKPVFAIGGITLENVERVMEQGPAGVAVISAIMGKDVYGETKKFVERMRK